LDGSVWPSELCVLGESIAPTLYDFGDDITDWARGVLDLAPAGPLDLVGNSVGGSCALEVAVLAPRRVRSIVMIGSKAGHRPEPEFRDEALRVLAEDGIGAAWERYWLPLFAPDADPTVIARARAITAALGADVVARGVRAFHGRPDRHDFALSLDIPILTVGGEFDIRPARSSDVLVEGSGHYVPLERPAALTRVVREFLSNSSR
jgi:pimeloyl-ACP methyl ester carboxylesterase